MKSIPVMLSCLLVITGLKATETHAQKVITKADIAAHKELGKAKFRKRTQLDYVTVASWQEPTLPTAKTTAVKSRPIAYKHLNAFVGEVDSSRFYYSSLKHGSDKFNTLIQFDSAAVSYTRPLGTPPVSSGYKKQTLDAAGNILTAVVWNTVKPMESSFDTHTYTPFNKLAGTITQSWDGSSWQATEKRSLAYDRKGNLVNDTLFYWDGAWIGYESYTYTYTRANQMQTRKYNIFVDGTWATLDSFSYVYDRSFRLIFKQRSTYDWTYPGFIPVERSNFTFNTAGNPVEENVEYWDGDWYPWSRIENTFDAASNKIRSITWMGDDTASMDTYSFNAFGQLQTESHGIKMRADNYMLMDSFTYFFEEYELASAKEFGNNNSFSIFPLPANKTISIKAAIPVPEVCTVQVYDLNGRSLYTHKDLLQPNQVLQISCETFPAGNYWVAINGNSLLFREQISIIH